MGVQVTIESPSGCSITADVETYGGVKILRAGRMVASATWDSGKKRLRKIATPTCGILGLVASEDDAIVAALELAIGTSPMVAAVAALAAMPHASDTRINGQWVWRARNFDLEFHLTDPVSKLYRTGLSAEQAAAILLEAK